MEQAQTQTDDPAERYRYPLSLRVLHWLRAILVLSLVFVGWLMMNVLPETHPMQEVLFPNHKQFGILVFIITLIALTIRRRTNIPETPTGLAKWEAVLSRFTHRAMYVLALLVPLMGYSMSSSFTLSDGVPFFGVMLPELLPKNDAAFEVFETLHHWLAYTLLGLVVLHVAGVVKHRLLDRNRDNDVLPRML